MELALLRRNSRKLLVLSGLLAQWCLLSFPLQAQENYDDWTYLKTWTINTTSSGADISTDVHGFPLLIRLDADNFDFGQAKASGEDIRFSKADGSHLAYEIERWDGGGESAALWVNVDTVYGGNGTQYFRMHWGKADAADSSNPQEVFSTANGFAGVWHLGGSFTDATSNNNDGTNSGSSDVAGAIGRGRSFNGTSDYIALDMSYQNTGAVPRVTVCAWFNTSFTGGGWTDNWSFVDYDRSEFYNFFIRGDDGAVSFGTNSPTGGTHDFDGATAGLNDGTWHCACAVYDGTDKIIYVDGQRDNTVSNPHSGDDLGAAGMTRYGFIGDGSEANSLDGTRNGLHYEGYIDELRVGDAVRSDDWIKLCYENQKPGSEIVHSLRIWDGGGADNNWSTPENWSADVVPTQRDDVLFDTTSSKNCVLDVSVTVEDLQFTADYTGQFDFGSNTLTILNDADFSLGGTIDAGSGQISFSGTTAQIFTPVSNQTLPSIIQTGSGSVQVTGASLKASSLTIGSGTVDFGDEGRVHTIGSITTTGGALDFGTARVSVGGAVDLSGLSSLTAASGTLSLTGTATQQFTPKDATTVHPSIHQSGTGTLRIAGSKLLCTAFSQSAGTMDFNGNDLETTGDLEISGGSSASFAGLGGRTLTIGGSASFTGQPTSLLNLNPAGGWTVSVGTALSAIYASIDNSTVTSAPPDGQATQCIDGGANTGWTFDHENYDDWQYSRDWLINTTSSGADISGNVTRFPLLVRLSASNFDFSEALANGQDIRFAKANGIHLDYEIEYWNAGAQSAAVWVKIDTVYGNNSSQYFTMHWGKSDAIDRSGGAGVFETTNGFDAVWHMGSDLTDATGNGNDGTNSGSVSTATLIGEGNDFDGGSDYIAIQNLSYAGAAYGPISVSAWAKTTADNGIMASWDRSEYWRFGVGSNATAQKFTFNINDSQNGTIQDRAGVTTITDDQWHHLVAVYDGGSMILYVDGEQDASFSVGSTFGTGLTRYGFLGVGSEADAYDGSRGPSDYYNGLLDEMQLHSLGRSADWIKLCYQSQKPGSNVVFTPKTWDGEGGDTNWSTAENWSDNTVPLSTDDVVFDNTSVKNCVLDADVSIRSITFDDLYTGTFSFGTRTLTVTGSADFDGGGTIDAASGTLTLSGTTEQLLVPPSGDALPDIDQAGSGGVVVSENGLTAGALSVSAGVVDFGDYGAAHTLSSLSTSGGSIDFGDASLEITGNVDLAATSSVSSTSDAVMSFTGTGAQTVSPAPSGTHPSLVHSGTGALAFTGDISCRDFTQSAGSIDFDGRAFTVAGNLTVLNGTAGTISGLAGATFTVSGNAQLSGQKTDLLNLDGGAWTISASGTLVANYVTLGGSNAGGGSAGEAYNSIDQTGNTNWTFIAEDLDADWTYSKNAYINTTPSGANITSTVDNFPLLIRLDATNFNFSQAGANGEDIRFTNSSGTPLKYEIEQWDAAGEQAAIWVNVDRIYGNNKTQYVTMYWGNGTAIDRSNPGGVFSSINGFDAVWHLHDHFLDATESGNDGTNNGSSNTAGVIGDGQSFDGSNDYIAIANYVYNGTGYTATTVSAWVNTNTDGSIILSWDRSEYWRFGIGSNATASKFSFNVYDGGIQDEAGTTTVDDGQWHLLTARFGSGLLRLYVDGELDATHSVGSTFGKGTTRYGFIGDGSEADVFDGNRNNSEYNGLADEVIIAGQERSGDWIRLCYQTQKPGASCVSFSEAPIVTGLSNGGTVDASQTRADSVAIGYEVVDPDDATVTISAEYRATGGSWSSMTQTAGDIGAGIDATSADADHEILWGMRTQLGTTIEGDYLVRVIADDGSSRDTVLSDTFFIDTRAPLELADFEAADTTGNSVTLTWSPASDGRFDHYEIWYGQVQVDVQNRQGGAVAWDHADDPVLGTASTIATTITGLSENTTYYLKIWAVDSVGNEATVTDIVILTRNMVAPSWSRSSLGGLNGGAVSWQRIFVGSGPSAYTLYSINLANGNTQWTYSTAAYGACGQPTSIFSETLGKDLVLASAGNYVIGRRDNSTGSSPLFAPVNLSAAAGPPYADSEDAFVVVYDGGVTRRSMADGSVMSGWPRALANASTQADPVVFNDEIYVATTGGLVCQYDMDGTPGPTYDAGASVELPLWSDGSVLYVTPNSTKVHAISTSTMTANWEYDVGAVNSGALFMPFTATDVQGTGVLYVAAGNTVKRLIDNGGSAGEDWSYDAASTVRSGPIVYNGTVYFGRADGRYYALDDASGTVKTAQWPYTDASGDADIGPWIDPGNSRVLFGTVDGDLAAFELE